MSFKYLFGTLALSGALLLGGCSSSGERDGADGGKSGDGKPTIAIMPKLVGIDYFSAIETGAREAAKDLDVNLVWDGPIEGDASKQIEILDTWIARGVDAIAVAPNDPEALAPTLDKARKRGVKVLTFDADANEASRDYFVNQATAQSIGESLVDEMAEQIGGAGEVAIITGSLTAANQNEWIRFMEARAKDKYPQMTFVATKPSEENQQLATTAAQDLLKAHPNLKGIFGITSVAFPAAALAVNQAGKSGQVAVVGLATPKSMIEHVDNGSVKTVLLWNVVDLGYLTVQVADQLIKNDKLGDSIEAGRLGTKQIEGSQVLLGAPMKFNKDNIRDFDF